MRTAFLTLLLFLASAFPVRAQAAYPSKPLRWIVPFPPGGPTDTFSRPVAQKLSDLLGQPVVVENIAGAAASIGTDRLAKSAPDGYTVALATTGTHAINPHLYGARLPYDALKDFTPLTLAVKYVNVLVVNPGVPARDVAELVAFARANPGKVTFGSAGNGSSNHLSGEVLKYVTGASMQHVPYKGSAAALTDVIAGNITYMFDTAKLNESLVQALRSPEIRQRLSAQAFEPWASTPEEFAQVIRTDHQKWGRIVKASGAKVD